MLQNLVMNMEIWLHCSCLPYAYMKILVPDGFGKFRTCLLMHWFINKMLYLYSCLSSFYK
uniref:Uncharacterized protein n=1 Tax=Arundo donax TaxID=35708 RepID=A0A0A9GQ01_ARUDO